MNPFIAVGSIFAVVVALTLSGSVVEFNENGQYQVLQSVDGDLTVIQKPGPYGQWFGTVTTYPYTDTIHFSNKDEDGADTAPEVRFNDAGTAKISGFIQFSLPKTEQEQLALHQSYKSYDNFKHNVVRRLYPAALIQSASLMKAEESYSSRRSEFRSVTEEQLELGLFDTVSEEVRVDDVNGNDFIERTVKVKYQDGKPVVKQASPFQIFGVDVVAFTINEIDFDETVDGLIAKKKEAEQQKVVARANAERAKQDAITAEEQGKAQIAVAKAEKEVEKIAAVTAAQKEAEVASWQKKRDKELADAALIKAKAEADGNRLKVAAGLTPLERATIEKETAIGVANALANAKFPTVFVAGGEKGISNPLEAMGYEAMYNLSQKMADKK